MVKTVTFVDASRARSSSSVYVTGVRLSQGVADAIMKEWRDSMVARKGAAAGLLPGTYRSYERRKHPHERARIVAAVANGGCPIHVYHSADFKLPHWTSVIFRLARKYPGDAIWIDRDINDKETQQIVVAEAAELLRRMPNVTWKPSSANSGLQVADAIAYTVRSHFERRDEFWEHIAPLVRFEELRAQIGK